MIAKRKPDILLVDEDALIRRLLRQILEQAGYAVREAGTARTAFGEITLQAPDLLILDPELPDLSGPELLRAIRALSSAPVLVLSVLGPEQSKIAALDAGADDYLTKPFASGELLARLRALLRRAQPAAAPERNFRFGPIEVDLERSRVLRHGQMVKLTAMEYGLMRLLVMHHDKVLTHRQILRELWGPQAARKTNYLRIYVMRLRRKLGEDLGAPGHFQTESGVGYRFVSHPPAPT